VACAVSQRLFDLAVLLHHAADGLAVTEIAAALFVAPSSVAKYVQRLNAAISEGFGGIPVKLVAASPTGNGSGYALAVPADGRTSQGRTDDGPL
jgi:hypothetical protein